MAELMPHLNRLAPLYDWGDATAITPMQPGFVRMRTASRPQYIP
jgi:hypothetical protein